MCLPLMYMYMYMCLQIHVHVKIHVQCTLAGFVYEYTCIVCTDPVKGLRVQVHVELCANN